ncbi:hypothetical protein MSG28_012731 [Choristoneura fumiferana]|uniref:Uncharacterized protein n=1 Tax=Choristoneura fumiferana TaxID=7141 RepID=A0ACC0JHR2_CHOFU|nr:hypothetical protein MSG28_012731 [Choristoneura fumiferana]
MEETIQAFHNVLSVAGVTIFAKNNWDSKLWLTLQIFNVIVGFLTIIFTTCFVVINLSDILVCIQGACIWTTGLIMFISFGVCLVFRKEFRLFLNEMGFKDHMLEMPLIIYVLKLERGGRLNELKGLVIDSHEKLLKLTRVLLKTYVVSVWLCASLYLSDSVYQMATREDDSLRLMVCVCSVKIAISDKSSPDTIKYYIHEFCFILVVLMFCLLGQQVENELTKV